MIDRTHDARARSWVDGADDHPDFPIQNLPLGIVGPIGEARTHAAHLYWTPGQMIAHHSSNGCNLEPGDMLGTGTISAPGREGFGSLMEITEGGREPFALPSGEQRTFLEDGDRIVLTGRCMREDFRTIGFGECRAEIRPAINQGETA